MTTYCYSIIYWWLYEILNVRELNIFEGKMYDIFCGLYIFETVI